MKNFLAFGIRILICLGLVVGAYFWAMSLMASVYAYRSPLKDQPPQPGEHLLPPGVQPATRRVVFVLLDGLRVDTALDAQVMPVLAQLRDQGAWAVMHSQPASYSAPGYSTLLTGAWPEVNDGPAINPEDENFPACTQDDLFAAAQRAGMKTAIAGFIYFAGLLPQTEVDAHFYTREEDDKADQQVMAEAQPWLDSGAYQLVLIHLDQVDYAGHDEGGPRDPRWNAAAGRVDKMLGKIASMLDLNPENRQDTLFVASDHGHIDRGGHGGHEKVTLREPFLLAGAGVRPGKYADVDMVDVAPTLAALLGASLPASGQGRVREEMLDLPAEEVQALPQALEAQQEQLLQAYTAAIGRSANPAIGGDIVGTYQEAMQSARKARLNAERLPRILLALLVAILPLAWFWRQRRNEIGWFLGGGLAAVALFNLRYAILDGRTYSLSSVASADDLILFCAVTAGAAFLISWLAASVLRRIFRLSPSQASLWTLDLSLATLYLMSLPVLWSFALNGAVVTWTLPDFPSMFLGFLALLQVLVVAAVGLLLSAGAAGIAWAVQHQR
jgi:hypothetical protein